MRLKLITSGVVVVEGQLQLREEREEEQIREDSTNENGMTSDSQSPLMLVICNISPPNTAQLAKSVIREMQMSSLCKLDGNEPSNVDSQVGMELRKGNQSD